MRKVPATSEGLDPDKEDEDGFDFDQKRKRG